MVGAFHGGVSCAAWALRCRFACLGECPARGLGWVGFIVYGWQFGAIWRLMPKGMGRFAWGAYNPASQVACLVCLGGGGWVVDRMTG